MNIDKIKNKIVKRRMLLTGLSLLIIALLLAFASINVEPRSFESEEKVLEGDGDLEFIESRYQSINSSIEMNFHPVNEEDTGGVMVVIRYENENETIEVDHDENKTIEIDDGANYIVSDFDSKRGNLTFTQTINYKAQPYGLLSIPAFILTIISLIFVYQGKYQMKLERKIEEEQKKLKEEEKLESQGSSSEPKFMGVDWGKKE
ncbi:MAG: hypothetical protein R6W73_02640 [Candidatus Saliniplasma sp.]